MSTYKSPKSPYYSYDFQLHGRRFHGSTKARNKKDADAIERQLKAKAKADLEAERRSGQGPLTVDIACGRYWAEVGERHSNNGDTWRNLERLVSYFGADKRLDEITDGDVAAFVSWRCKQHVTTTRRNKDGELATVALRPITNATVNRTALVPLKAVCRRAAKVWRVSLPLEPIWASHWLKEPVERVRALHEHEDAALEDAIRDDYRPWMEFVRITGWRFDETLIRWKNVNLFARTITTTGKRGQKLSIPITPEIEALLKPLKDHHADAVFTYVCTRTRDGKVKGQRYPITNEGAKSQWQRIRAKSGVQDFRFHDFRHDTATRALRATGSLKIVQRMLGHTSISTTSRYAHVLDDDLADALSRTAQAREKSRKKSQNKAGKAA